MMDRCRGPFGEGWKEYEPMHSVVWKRHPFQPWRLCSEILLEMGAEEIMHVLLKERMHAPRFHARPERVVEAKLPEAYFWDSNKC
jgi:hypothetical protein